MSMTPLQPIGGGLQPVGGETTTSTPPVTPPSGAPPPMPPITAATSPQLTPTAQVQNPWAMQTNSDKFAVDKFLLNQKLFSMNSKYFVYDEYERPLFYVDRPLFKLKTKIGVYEDEPKTKQALSVEVESMWSILNYTFIVSDASGNTIGYLRRKGWLSLLRRTWQIEDASGRTLATASEDSWWKAILRRILSSVDLEIISAMIRTNFIIEVPETNQRLGEFIRRYSIQDKYVMDLTSDPQRTLDRRLMVGLAIVLDNAERR